MWILSRQNCTKHHGTTVSDPQHFSWGGNKNTSCPEILLPRAWCPLAPQSSSVAASVSEQHQPRWVNRNDRSHLPRSPSHQSRRVALALRGAPWKRQRPWGRGPTWTSMAVVPQSTPEWWATTAGPGAGPLALHLRYLWSRGTRFPLWLL